METNEISNDIIQKAAEGDMQAFEDIYRAFSGFVYNVSLRILGNSEDAQETAQDVFIKVFNSLKNFEYKSSLKTWLYRVSVNTALNKKRTIPKYAELDESFQGAVMDSSHEKKDNEMLVNSLLGRLSAEHRTCLVLREMRGLSYEEIAETLDININTVRSRIKRARERLLEINRGDRNEL